MIKDYCIYLLILPNDKFYVGLTSDFRRRFINHRRRFENIKSFQILHSSISLIQANIWERIEIANYKSYKYQKNSMGYNKTLGGSGHQTKLELKKRRIIIIKNINRIKIAESMVGKRIKYFNVIKLLDIAVHYLTPLLQIQFKYIIKCIYCKREQIIIAKKDLLCSKDITGCNCNYVNFKKREFKLKNKCKQKSMHSSMLKIDSFNSWVKRVHKNST